MGWLDKVKAGLTVAGAVTKVLPTPSWVKQAQRTASAGVDAYGSEGAAWRLPSDLEQINEPPFSNSMMFIQMPDESKLRRVNLLELAWTLEKIKKATDG